MADDVMMTFDPQPFVDAIDNVIFAMSNLEDKADEITQAIDGIADSMGSTGETTKNVSRGIQQSVTGVVARLAILKTAFDGIRRVISEIPEIGQAFNIARDIILKNFLFPLRQQLLPVLQGILDWVRDNRSQFARWGQIVANVFRVAFNFAKRLAEGVGVIFRAIQQVLTGIFGLPPNLEDAINVILFKLAATAEFIGQLLGPVFDLLGQAIVGLEPVFNLIQDILEAALRVSVALGEGFLSGLDIERITAGLSRIAVAIGRIIFGTEDAEETIKRWEDAFRSIGEFIGGAFTSAIEFIANIIEGIVTGIEKAAEFLGITSPPEARGTGADRRRNPKTPVQPIDDPIPSPPPVPRAGANTPGLSNIGGGSKNITVTSSLNIDGVQINVTEGNAEQAGKNFISGMDISFREQIIADMERVGI